MVGKSEVAVQTVEGLAEGLALNYLWEGLRLPGYGIKLTTSRPGFVPDSYISLGLDDVFEMLIGAGIAIYGYTGANVLRIVQGLAIMGAIGLTKLFEGIGIRVTSTPLSPLASSCPVCGTHTEEQPLGIDVTCPQCGFVSAWTRS